jgi:hypothetical protein
MANGTVKKGLFTNNNFVGAEKYDQISHDRVSNINSRDLFSRSVVRSQQSDVCSPAPMILGQAPLSSFRAM